MAERHCASCSAPRPTDGGPDPCLGWLPGLRFACCGHGYQRHAYAVHDDDFDGSRVVRGKEAVRLLRDLGGNPPRPRNRWLLVSDERQWRAGPARRSPVTDQPKSAPAMFQGVRPSPAPSPNPTEQTKVDRAAATKTSGASSGLLGGIALVPIAAIGLIALAMWSPIAALIAGAALVLLLAIGWVARSSARRRMATTTRVRPDGSITTSTRPLNRQKRPASRDRSRNRNRMWPSRKPADLGGPRGSRTPGSSPSARNRDNGSPSGPGGPSSRRKFRDRLRPNRTHDAGKNPSGGPSGGNRSGGKDPKGPRGPGGSDRSRASRWNPFSRDKAPRGGPKSDSGPRGGGSDRNGPGRPKSKSPRSKNRQPPSGDRAPSAGKSPSGPGGKPQPPSGAPSSPGKRPQQTKGRQSRHHIDNGPSDRRFRTPRQWWQNAWQDGPLRQKRDKSAPSVKPSTKPADPASSSSIRQVEKVRRDWRRSLRGWSRRPRPVANDFGSKLDERWQSRGIGSRQAPRPDPMVSTAPPASASSASSAAFAEDWSPPKPSQVRDVSSAESTAFGEDWSPPTKAAQRKGSQMSTSGFQDQSTAATRSAAYEGASDAAARVSAAKGNLADTKVSQANGLAGREGMEGAAARMRSEGGALRQDSSTMASVAGKFRQMAASVGQIFNRK